MSALILIKVHISQLAKDRVENVNDIVSVGDEIFIKVTNNTLTKNSTIFLKIKLLSISIGPGSFY